MRTTLKGLAAFVVGGAMLCTAASADVSGAGASFPYPIYTKWADSFTKEAGTNINYQSIGSGGGIKQIKARTVTFGASDAPLKKDELEDAGLLQWPMIMGGIVPVINVEGIEDGQITFDGPTLAEVFLGQITQWDDPAIKKLNPDVQLPSSAIAVVHRSDGSGTTFNFTHYLSQISPEWKTKVGEATSVQWPVGIGAKGNEGVSNNVQQTANSIGYVESAYAIQNDLTTTMLVNKAGKAVKANSDTVQAAAANADWANAPGFYLLLTNQPGDQSWPIAASSFILMPKQVEDPQAASQALKFFSWSYENGDEAALELDYVPMPDNVVQLVKDKWSQIQSEDGKPVF